MQPDVSHLFDKGPKTFLGDYSRTTTGMIKLYGFSITTTAITPALYWLLHIRQESDFH